MMTNADRIRHMSDEELCELIMYGRSYCKAENPLSCDSAGMFKDGEYKSGCYICAEKWLKEDAEI